MSSMQKNVYVVLGMPRSGTSAITKGLSVLGIDLGETFTLAKQHWNPTGSWEDKDIASKVNRAMMMTLDYSWSTMGKLEAECADSRVQHIKKYACQVIKQRMESRDYWAFKDTHTTKILPFWRAVFTETGVQAHYVIALRNPLAAALSLQRVIGAELEVGFLTWMMHMVLAIDGVQGQNAMVVSYDAMMNDPRLQLQRMQQQLAIPDLTSAATIDAYAKEYLDGSLRHFDCDRDELKQHGLMDVFPLSLRIYDLLMQVATDALAINSTDFKAAWQDIKREFAIIYPTYSYMDTLLNRHKDNERCIKTIKKSLPWKLALPFRLIDNQVRHIRFKLRQKRKLLSSYSS
jgi:hypothetical protein